MRMSSQRSGVTGVFALSGVCCALWSATLPALVGRLGLGPGRMGTLLLAAGIGSLVAMPLIGRLTDRLTAGIVLTLCGSPAALCLLAPAWAFGYLPLLAAAALVGLGLGTLDMAMNAQAVVVEKAVGRPLMSRFHGVWSLGTVAGGLVVAVGMRGGTDPRVLLSAAGGLCAALFVVPLLLMRTAAAPEPGALAGSSRLSGPDPPGPAPLPGRLVLLLGLLAMAGFISEGSGYSWAVLHANRALRVTPASASVVYVIFTASITCSRLAGDRMRARLGTSKGLAVAGLTASAGYLLVLLAPELPSGRLLAESAGWGVAGAGLATIVPTLLTTAGSGGGDIGRTLSRVTTLAYVGSLSGPALVGFLAERSSLTTALALPGALALTVGLLGPPVARRASSAVSRTHATPSVASFSPAPQPSASE
jgi:predicted MFS family arabinose efflux permease